MDMVISHCIADIGTGKTKTIDQMAVEGDKTESRGKAASNETEESEGLSGMPEIENH
ncbi:MAG: hypothetical protein WCA79_17745 [Anaerolineales bacterium]